MKPSKLNKNESKTNK